MSYAIDQIPDEALRRLAPRRPGARDVLVTLAGCAPVMATMPLETDELWRVLTRLLTVPGGLLVSRDGTLVGAPLPSLPWRIADRPFNALTLDDIGLWFSVGYHVEHTSLAYVKRLVEYGVARSLALGKKQPWWPYAKDQLEHAASRNCGDTMLAGLPEP